MGLPVYDVLNKAWKSTCKILLGGEIGELKKYEESLKYLYPKVGRRISHISGRDVFTLGGYCSDARFVSMDEIKEKAVDPLTINEIKDIDSIVEAISEKWEYAGNKIFGNSVLVESADLIVDCQYVSECVDMLGVSYSFATYDFQHGKYLFGSGQGNYGEFLVGFFGGNNIRRCFSSSLCIDCSDIYLSHNCYGCHDLMFSFSQFNKGYFIGNLQLPKDKYFDVKSKLLTEIREEIIDCGQLPSLYRIVPNKEPAVSIEPPITRKEQKDIKQVEKAFSSVSKILFRKEFGDIALYEQWLSERTTSLKKLTTPFGSEVYVGQHPRYKLHSTPPERRAVTYEECIELGKLRIDEGRPLTLKELTVWIGEVCCFCPDFRGGKNWNIIDSAVIYDSINLYKSHVCVKSENIGISSWALYSKYAFGCNSLKESQFCLNCYDSSKLTRCFEVDSSASCTDTYFAHNCEGLSDAMFCWNTKGKRYVIGNLQLLPEQYRKIKDMLVGQMADEIIKKKELRYDIFNIGGGRIKGSRR